MTVAPPLTVVVGCAAEVVDGSIGAVVVGTSEVIGSVGVSEVSDTVGNTTDDVRLVADDTRGCENADPVLDSGWETKLVVLLTRIKGPLTGTRCTWRRMRSLSGKSSRFLATLHEEEDGAAPVSGKASTSSA